MSPSPIMPAADTRNLMALSMAATTMDAEAASGGGAALLVQAQALDTVRDQLRDGETISVTV
jgi:hypothetical protein